MWIQYVLESKLLQIFDSLDFEYRTIDLLKDVVIDNDKELQNFGCEDFEDFKIKCEYQYSKFMFNAHNEILSEFEMFTTRVLEQIDRADYLTMPHAQVMKKLLRSLKITEDFNNKYKAKLDAHNELRQAILHRDFELSNNKDISLIKGAEIKYWQSERKNLKSISEDTLNDLNDLVLEISKYITSKLPIDFESDDE